MSTCDVDAVADVYADDARLFGSLPRLFIGRDGVREYFEQVRSDSSVASFDNESVLRIDPLTILAAGFVEFMVVKDQIRSRHRYRFTFVLRSEAGVWRILLHHASPMPPAT